MWELIYQLLFFQQFQSEMERFLIKIITFYAVHCIWKVTSKFSFNFQYKTSFSFTNKQYSKWIKLFKTHFRNTWLTIQPMPGSVGSVSLSLTFCLAFLSSNQWLKTTSFPNQSWLAPIWQHIFLHKYSAQWARVLISNLDLP